MMTKTYNEAIKYASFEDRLKYLRCYGSVGIETFGFDRYLNQWLYHSPDWRRIRNEVIIRDKGCDLAVDGWVIQGRIIIHHIDPLTQEDLMNHDMKAFDPNNLICCSIATHNAIHYANTDITIFNPVERSRNDTCPWK